MEGLTGDHAIEKRNVTSAVHQYPTQPAKAEFRQLDGREQALLATARSRPPSARDEARSRCFDLLAASLLLVLATPILGLAVVAVRLTSRGPVFFSSERYGRNGTTFGAWKLRTMIDGAGLAAATPEQIADLSAQFKLRDDPRITRVGLLLRRCSIDELPQLINILRGEMSLVGPRPKLVAEKPRYGDAFEMILSVRPGLTGHWQTSGRNDLPFEARIELDLEYVATRSLRGDMGICWRTAIQLLSPRRHGAF